MPVSKLKPTKFLLRGTTIPSTNLKETRWVAQTNYIEHIHYIRTDRPFDLSRFQENSNVTIPRLDHVSSPRAGNSVSGEDTVQRTTKLFYATRSANSTIGSAPDPVFFALTNFACREAGWGREKFAGGTRRENVQQRGSQEIAAMSQTRLLILWLAAYEWRGEKNSKLSTRVTALRRMNLCVPQPCIRVYFFLDFLLSCEPMTRLIVAAIIALSSPITLFSCLFTYFFYFLFDRIDSFAHF